MSYHLVHKCPAFASLVFSHICRTELVVFIQTISSIWYHGNSLNLTKSHYISEWFPSLYLLYYWILHWNLKAVTTTDCSHYRHWLKTVKLTVFSASNYKAAMMTLFSHTDGGSNTYIYIVNPEAADIQGSFCEWAQSMRDGWRYNITSSFTGWGHSQNDP